MGPICRDVGDKMSSHEIGNVLRDERFASLESIVWADSELAPLVIYTGVMALLMFEQNSWDLNWSMLSGAILPNSAKL